MTLTDPRSHPGCQPRRSRPALRPGRHTAWLRTLAGLCVIGCIALVSACISGVPATGSSASVPGEAPAPQTDTPAPQNGGLLKETEPTPYSLEGLAAHGLSEDAYLSGGRDARSAWLLAATHLRYGVIDPQSGTARLEPDPAIAARADPGTSGTQISLLDAYAPQTRPYLALQAALARAQDPDQIARLQVSLERLRRLPRPDGARAILANIPGFEVITYDEGRQAARRRAIVGRPSRQTPEFSDLVEFIVFNPWWEVPGRIAVQDKLPLFRRDPSAVGRLGYQVLDRAGQAVDPADIDWAGVDARAFPYRLRQAPGPHNALGRVKFMFPNTHDVYLHDTPDRSLFDLAERALSSGCVRISDPVDMAEWLLSQTPGWDRLRIDNAIASAQTVTAQLAQPVPIHLVYLTAFPSADGTIAYMSDLYARDSSLLRLLTPWLIPSPAPASPAGPLEAAQPVAIIPAERREISDNGNSLYCGG